MSIKNIRFISPQAQQPLPTVPDRFVPLSSQDAWDGILLERHYLPPLAVSEVIFRNSAITFQLCAPVTLEKSWGDGQYSRQLMLPGDLTITPPGLPHSARWDGNVEVLAIYLEPSLTTRTIQEWTSRNQPLELCPYQGKSDPLVRGIFLTLHQELETGCLSDSLYAQQLGTTLAVHLLKQHSTFQLGVRKYKNGLTKCQLNQVLEYIHCHLDQKISLNELTQLLDMSPSYLCRLFKQSTGMTLYQYVLQQRVERAKRLLRQQNTTSAKLPRSMADIAYQCGFANQSHLNKHFKQQTGMTPQQYCHSL